MMYQTSYLSHHGILGMKWGIRRYQNKDGSLTAEGRRRLGYGKDSRVDFDEKGRVAGGQEGKTRTRIHEEVANDYRNVSTIARESSSASRSGQNIANQSARKAREKAMSDLDVSSMSDKELQAAINRMNLERTYKSLSTEQVGSGQRYVSDMLQTAGDVLAIAGSIAGIMVAIHQLRK